MYIYKCINLYNINENYLQKKGVKTNRIGNNIYAFNQFFDENKPTILLNSHHDTVKPNKGYTRNPLSPDVEDGKLYGLGSNDAGGCLVSLLATFTYFYNREDLKYNFVIVASAEEENSGQNGLNSMLKIIPEIDFAIVGEPTLMQLAIAEKGLMVLNCEANGTAGHAAHGTGDNAIYNAIKDIHWFQTYEFPKVSETLGKVKMTVTQIKAGKQHNAVPAEVELVIDVRVNDRYTNEEISTYVSEFKQQIENKRAWGSDNYQRYIFPFVILK